VTQTSGVSWRLGYRPGLNGLRAMAVGIVMCAHLRIPGFVGAGAAGVTLFFVLSGFLITTLLAEERAHSGIVSLRAFYARRGLRLLPALVAMALAFSLVTALQGEAAAVPGRLLPALLYVGDFARASGAELGYFNHTWSLAIEEQFYTLWPLAFILVVAGRRAGLPWVLAAAMAAVAWRALLVGLHAASDRLLWAPDMHADALLAGCALALVVQRYGLPRLPRWWIALGVVLAAASVALCAASLTATYGLTVGTIAGVVLVAGLASRDDAGPFVWRPVVYLGVISYGLYLWHVPVTKALAAFPGPVVAALSIGIAAVSYRWIEQPFLRRKPRGHSQVAVRALSEVSASPST
jgi:peptidoglycan/LPS O-acetylase OafA/YrhL